MLDYDVAIVGAGHAGSQAAISLRELGFSGTIGLIGEEREAPYERPPLTKDYLGGTKPFDRMLIRAPGFWAQQKIDLQAGLRVVAVDPKAHEITLASDGTLTYGTLIWAAGGRPRRLACAGQDLIGVHYVRNRADVDRMIAELDQTTRVVVIGGGYIGLEAAGVLTTLGKRVTVLEALDRVLARVAGEPLSRFYEAEHRSRGVEVRLGAKVECLEEADGHVVGVRLDDGEVLPAEMVIVGIGILPAVEPLLAAGAQGGPGVTVDETCRTTLADIFAIGDCAAHVSVFARGATVRLESVQNAADQATTAAKAIMGAPEPYMKVPWFWSDQYDLRLQTVGLSTGYDSTVVRGVLADRKFSIIYLRDGRVIALDCINSPKDYIQGRALVIAGASATPERLADTRLPLKDLASTAA